MSLTSLLDDARQNSAGRMWQPRALLLLACAFIFFRHLQDPLYGGIAKGLNLAIHEMGHVVFGFFGNDFLMIAGGTILQLSAPLVAFWMFYRQRDYFAIAIAFCWLATNLFDVAAYAGDARLQALPLVSIGGGDPEHDWYAMLSQMNLLKHDTTIAAVIRGLAILSFTIGIGFGAWVLREMAMPDKLQGTSERENE